MVIGLIDTQIASLSLFKEWVKQHPIHDYAAYIETNEVKDMAKACAWMQERNADLVVLGDGVSKEDMPLDVFSAPMVPISEALTHIQNLKKGEVVGEGWGTLRAIHITQHSKEQDQQLALLLGGYFVEG